MAREVFIPRLKNSDICFPDPRLAIADGLVAYGGDLSPNRLLMAYRKGIFPWYNDGDPILWWSPDPRLVLYPSKLHVSRSLKKVISSARFEVRFDTDFASVIQECAKAPRAGQQETWIVPEMIQAYKKLHEMGYAHSVEVYQEGKLAGGLYGVSLGGAFFGESMFSKASNASKVALYHLVLKLKEWHFDFIDCQVTTEHLVRMGAEEIGRDKFLDELKESLNKPSLVGSWKS